MNPTKYVVRSMSTTDYCLGGPAIRQYHIYLLPRAERKGAYWATYGAQVFDTPQEAEAEAKRSLPRDDHWQIAPLNDTTMMDYWDLDQLIYDRSKALGIRRAI